VKTSEISRYNSGIIMLTDLNSGRAAFSYVNIDIEEVFFGQLWRLLKALEFELLSSFFFLA
jgi:hypothetical protein